MLLATLPAVRRKVAEFIKKNIPPNRDDMGGFLFLYALMFCFGTNIAKLGCKI